MPTVRGMIERLLRPTSAGIRLRVSVAAAVVATFSACLFSTLDRRVTERVDDRHEIGRQRWMALVESGVSQDSATVVTLRDMHDRLAGQPVSVRNLPLSLATDGELVWQARMLNPLQPNGGNLPRSDVETRLLDERRASVREVIRQGRSAVEQRMLRWSLFFTALSAFAALACVVWFERRSGS